MTTAPLSLEQQADLVQRLISRCTHMSGTVAKETWLSLEDKDVADLRHIEARLRRMAPFEAAIKRVVTGR